MYCVLLTPLQMLPYKIARMLKRMRSFNKSAFKILKDGKILIQSTYADINGCLKYVRKTLLLGYIFETSVEIWHFLLCRFLSLSNSVCCPLSLSLSLSLLQILCWILTIDFCLCTRLIVRIVLYFFWCSFCAEQRITRQLSSPIRI